MQFTNPKPHLRMKRYPFPAQCSIRSIVMRELDGDDDIEASVIADKNAGELVKDSQYAALQADHRESIRISLVAVNDKQLEAGVPYMEMDTWSSATHRVLQHCYTDLNGVEAEDLKNVIAGAEELGQTPIRTDSEGEAQDGE